MLNVQHIFVEAFVWWIGDNRHKYLLPLNEKRTWSWTYKIPFSMITEGGRNTNIIAKVPVFHLVFKTELYLNNNNNNNV